MVDCASAKAMWLYSGPAFKALNPPEFSKDEVKYAQVLTPVHCKFELKL